MEDCFAFKPKKCIALKHKKCEGCNFYKTHAQHEMDKEKAFEKPRRGSNAK